MLRESEIHNILHSVPMRELAAMYGYKVTPSGFMRCPFHGDKHPSMKVYDKDRGYYCFVCNCGGDVIDFVRKHDGLAFEPAVRHIAEMFSIPLSDENTELSPKDKKAISDRKMKREAAETARRDRLNRLKTLSEHIHRLEGLQAEFKPLSGLWCAIQKKYERLCYEWDLEFETYGRGE